MSNEIAKSETALPAVRTDMNEVFRSLVELAKDPSVDAGKMTSLVDLQMKMMDYSKQEEFNQAKIAAIMEMPHITKKGEIKNKGVTQSRYSKFEDIHNAVMPVLKRHNLMISFNVGHNGGAVTVQPILSHTNGHVEKGGEMSLPLDTQGSKNGTQGAGSSTSYGKRYTMVAMLNIVEDGKDNDGRGDGPKPKSEIEKAAEQAANCGTAAFSRWYKEDISRQERFDLSLSPHFEDFKKMAADADAAQ